MNESVEHDDRYSRIFKLYCFLLFFFVIVHQASFHYIVKGDFTIPISL